MAILKHAKFAILQSALLSKEGKQVMLARLPKLNEEQLKKLVVTLKKYDKKMQPIISRAFQGESGESKFHQLQSIHNRLKRNVLTQREAQTSTDADTQLSQSLNEI